MITLPVAKVVVAVVAGCGAYTWGELAEKHITSTRGQAISFSLLIVFAVGVGVYLFYF